MPRWMRHFLKGKSLADHFRLSLALGLLTRSLTAFFVYGPQALDDYKHGVFPAYQFFAGLPLELPDYRSHLLVWLLGGFATVGDLVGAHSALAQVRVMYFGLAVVSLLGIYGTYLFVRTFRSRLFAALGLYLVAVFPLMPFISTRAFGESVAMSFVLLGFGVLEAARRTDSRRLLQWTLGFAFLGIATLFRFHVGLLFLGYGVSLLVLKNKKGIFGAVLGGIFTLAAQFLIDAISGKPAFGTLLSYLAENEGGAAKYGASPWWNTWAFVLALTLAPFSFVFVGQLRGLWRRHWPWLAPFLLFVLAHSLVPHKEERFLYPIVGLELWALAWVWASATLFKPARLIYSSVLIGLSVPLLFVVCFVNSQEGEIEPPAYAESHYHNVVYLDYQSLFGMSRVMFYFLRPPSLLETVSKEDFNVNKIDSTFESHPEEHAAVLITSAPEARAQLFALEGVKTLRSHCLTTRAAGSPIDRLLYALNPKHNERRRPTWYLICERD